MTYSAQGHVYSNGINVEQDSPDPYAPPSPPHTGGTITWNTREYKWNVNPQIKQIY